MVLIEDQSNSSERSQSSAHNAHSFLTVMLRLRNYNGTDIGFASDRSYYLNELSVRIFLLMCSHTIPGDGMVIYHERYSDGPLVSVGAPVQSESALSIATAF